MVPRNTSAEIVYRLGLADAITPSRLREMRGTKAYERCLLALKEIAPENARKAQKIATELYRLLEAYSGFGHASTAFYSIPLFELALFDYCEEAVTFDTYMTQVIESQIPELINCAHCGNRFTEGHGKNCGQRCPRCGTPYGLVASKT